MQFGVIVHGLIKRGNTYLFTKRRATAKFAPGKWDSPGGSLELGESPEEGVVRETLEETGLAIKVLNPVMVCSKVVPELDKQFINIIYLCDYIDGAVILNEEHTDFVWLPLSDLDQIDVVDYLKDAANRVK